MLANGDGTEASVGRTLAWYYQETHKGIKQSIPLFGDMGRNEAGWSFNTDHDHVSSQYLGGTLVEHRWKLSNEEACALSNSVLRVNPFFGHFANTSVYTPAEGIDANTNATLRAQLLADAIPAESFAVGRNPVPAWESIFNSNRNENLASKKNTLPSMPWTVLQDDRWLHTFFLSVPYMFVNVLYRDIVHEIKMEQ